MLAAAKNKQRFDWDHTADLLAMMASLHSKGNYQREHFHPMREAPEPLHLDDPKAEYERLMREKKR